MSEAPPQDPLRRALTLPFLVVIWTYQVTLGPFLGGHCRFQPTCSRYALQAYREHGPWYGTLLTVRRLLRCHPFGGRGYALCLPSARQRRA